MRKTDKTPLDEIMLKKLNVTIDPYLLAAYMAARDFAEAEFIKTLQEEKRGKKCKLTDDRLSRAKELFLSKKSHAYPILFDDLEEFGLGELLIDKTKLQAIKMHMVVFDNFMSSHNIIKLIGNRDQNNNTTLLPERVKQRSVQTGS